MPTDRSRSARRGWFTRYVNQSGYDHPWRLSSLAEPVMGCVYLLTNLENGKRYVGKALNESKRWESHKSTALHTSNCKPLYRALRKAHKKDGCWEGFGFVVIWRGFANQLNEKERYCIKKYHSFIDDPSGDRSYNLTSGGDGASIVANCTKNKMSAAQSRRYENLAEREKASIVQLLSYQKNPARRKKLSAAQIQSYAENLSRREKCSTAAIHRYENPEERNKTSRGNVRRFAKAEEREKLSIAATKRYEDPDERLRLSVAIRAGFTAKVRARLSRKLRASWKKRRAKLKAVVNG